MIGLPAGLQPRAAVGYMFCVAAELAALALAGPRIHTEIDAAASHLGRAFEATEARAPRAGRRDRRRHPGHLRQPPDRPGRVSLGDADQRERQVPAFSGILPEADHNQLEGWSGAEGRFAAIFLGDRDQHPRERRRLELTAKAIKPYAASVTDVETEGESRTERVLHTVMLGDLLAIELANARGVDPITVGVLEGFKTELGRPDGG